MVSGQKDERLRGRPALKEETPCFCSLVKGSGIGELIGKVGERILRNVLNGMRESEIVEGLDITNRAGGRSGRLVVEGSFRAVYAFANWRVRP